MNNIKDIVWGIGAVLFILSLSFFIFAKIRLSEDYIKKQTIQELIHTVINNGGSINDVRHIYESRKLEKIPLFVDEQAYLDSNYRSDISLSHILSDLQVKFYEKSDLAILDSLYIIRLQNIIADYNAVHPFDGLEENQKYYLQNIKQKLDSNYILIQDDLTKVGDELDRKNQLANKYLNKSELSFWISVCAVVLTIILSVWQINQNRKTNKKIELFLAGTAHSKG